MLLYPANLPKTKESTSKCTYDDESNMLDSMKHCVAMGGAAAAAA